MAKAASKTSKAAGRKRKTTKKKVIKIVDKPETQKNKITKFNL